MGTISPIQLRAISEKGLLLLTITIPEMEVLCWIFNLPSYIRRWNFTLSVFLFIYPVSHFLSDLYYIYNTYLTLQHILWPFLLKMIIPRRYTGAAATVSLYNTFFHWSYVGILALHGSTFFSSVEIGCVITDKVECLYKTFYWCHHCRSVDALQNYADMDLMEIVC